MNAAEQASIYDPAIWCGKTSPELSAQTMEKTLPQSLRKPSKSSTKTPPIFLSLSADGQKPDALPAWTENGALRGAFSMRSFGESPKEGKESHLSQILEASPHPKYFLSAKACMGILNRADRKGKPLPPQLREALEKQSGLSAFKATASTDPTPQGATAEDGLRESASHLTPWIVQPSPFSSPENCQGLSDQSTIGKTEYAPLSERRGGITVPQ